MKKLTSALSAIILTSSAANAQSLVEIPIKQNPPFEVSTNHVSVGLDANPGTLTIGGDIVVTGGSGSYSYHWYTPAGTELGTDRSLTVSSLGTYLLDIKDTCDCIQTVNFQVMDGAGVRGVEVENLIVSPNPTDGYIGFNGVEIVQLTAVNMGGQLSALIDGDGTAFTSADLSQLPSGNYVLLLTGADGKFYASKIIRK